MLLPEQVPIIETSCQKEKQPTRLGRRQDDVRGARTVLHHDLQELNDHLGGRPDQHLPLAALLGIVHALKGIVEDTDTHHRTVSWFGARRLRPSTQGRGERETCGSRRIYLTGGGADGSAGRPAMTTRAAGTIQYRTGHFVLERTSSSFLP